MFITVSQYDCEPMKQLYGFDNMILWTDDFFTLQRNEWICGNIVDSSMILKWYNVHNAIGNTRNVTFIPSAITNFIFGDMSSKKHEKSWHMYNLDWNFSGEIFLPYCLSSHWYLVMIDVEKEIFFHINPKRIYDKEHEDRAFKDFTKYLQQCRTLKPNNLCKINWKREIFVKSRPVQLDDVNCGVFVIYYFNCLAEGISMNEDFDPNEYRFSIAESLLSLSKPMENICLMCIRHEERKADSIKTCQICKRWSDEKCVMRKVKKGDIYVEVPVISSQNICVLCDL